MPRAVIVGSGTEIAPNLVTNDMLARVMDTSDAWIRERSGVETRYFANPARRPRTSGSPRPAGRWRRRGSAAPRWTSWSSPP